MRTPATPPAAIPPSEPDKRPTPDPLDGGNADLTHGVDVPCGAPYDGATRCRCGATLCSWCDAHGAKRTDGEIACDVHAAQWCKEGE